MDAQSRLGFELEAEASASDHHAPAASPCAAGRKNLYRQVSRFLLFLCVRFF